MQREKQAPHGEPHAGLNPQARGSQPEPKADATPVSHPGALDRPFHASLSWGFLPDKKTWQIVCCQCLLLDGVKVSSPLKRLCGMSWRKRERAKWTRRGEPGGPHTA